MVYATEALPRQQGADEKQGAALAALTAFSFSQRELSPHIALPELNQVEPPELADRMDHKARSH
jgi:hypothetical protein